MRSLPAKNIIANFKEFSLLKGKKTGYYLDTAENRRLGRVGQKYIIDVPDDIESKVQSQLNQARRLEDETGHKKQEKISSAEEMAEKIKKLLDEDKEWLENNDETTIGEDWRLSDNRVRNNLFKEEKEKSITDLSEIVLEEESDKELYVEDAIKDRTERSKFIGILIDKVRLLDDDKYKEELAWNKTKDAETIRVFNKVARRNNLTNLTPMDFVVESNIPQLVWDKENKHSFLTNKNKAVNLSDLKRETFKDHIAAENIWNNNSPTFWIGMTSPKIQDTIHWEDDEQLKDYLSRLSVLDVGEEAADDFFTNPYKFLLDNGFGPYLNKDTQVFGGIIVSTSNGDYLFLKKKVDFTVDEPSKKSTKVIIENRFKLIPLKYPIDNLNYQQPISVLWPIDIPDIEQTKEDEIGSIRRRLSKINIDSIERDIRDMESMPKYEQDEDELDRLYFKRTKYHEEKRELDKQLRNENGSI